MRHVARHGAAERQCMSVADGDHGSSRPHGVSVDCVRTADVCPKTP